MILNASVMHVRDLVLTWHAAPYLSPVPVRGGDEGHLRKATAKHTDGGGAHNFVSEMRSGDNEMKEQKTDEWDELGMRH